MSTYSKNEVVSNYIGQNSSGSSGTYSMKIGVRDDGVCDLEGVTLSNLSSLLGAGRYDKKDRKFSLDYSYRITSYNVCYTKLLRYPSQNGVDMFETADGWDINDAPSGSYDPQDPFV